MALDFPSTPANGQIYTDSTSGLTYVYINAYSYWAVAGGGGGGATTAGSNTNIQFNDSGALGGSNNFTYNKTTTTISVGNSSVNTTINSTASFASFGHMNPDSVGFDYTTTANVNSVLAGPVTIVTGKTLTITTGSRVVIV